MQWLKTAIQGFIQQPGNRKLFSLLALVLVGGWLVWLQDLSQPAPHTALPQEHGEPDYYLEQAELKRFNSEGRHFQTLEGEVITHYPESDLTHLTQPHVRHWTPSQQLWVIQAHDGEIRGEEEIFLENEVRLTPINPNSDYTPEFLTRRLWLDIQQETAQTSDPVTFQSPAGLTQGNGLFATLDQGQVTLLQDVQSHYLTQLPDSENQDTE
ncbi:LPS export ABC transporter periplasmic protein LptC [Marinospirillum sp.]|uniref:LPS export ABC transporter periplasmic protein LptC n=1 Tax=Marinospirillum sp. TaxID=2183934 RepID=UPI0028701D38|nr:LPS export ABC transporter periplasmic protein LptC [Marinospirillum sp.]